MTQSDISSVLSMNDMSENKEEVVLAVKQPESVHVELMPYQRAGIYMMESVEKSKHMEKKEDGFNISIETNIAFYSDSVGSGKTLTAIGLIARNRMKVDVENIHVDMYVSAGTISVKRRMKYRPNMYVDSTLVISSPSIVIQWEKEISKTDLVSMTIDTRAKIRDLSIEEASDYDVILCTTGMYKDFQKKFDTSYWKRVMFDEADSAHVPGMKRVNGEFTWLLTATPEYIHTVKGRGHWINQTFSHFPDARMLVIKNDDAFIDKCKKTPQYTTIRHKCFSPLIADVVAAHVDSGIMAMINAGDMAGAIASLGGIGDESIVDLVTKNYRDELKHAHNTLAEHEERKDAGAKALVKKWKERITEIEKKIQVLNDRFKDAMKETCSVCSTPFTDPVMISCCQNIACAECMFGWMKGKNHPQCIWCRKYIKEQKMTHLVKKGDEQKKDGEGKSEEKEEKRMTKDETLLKIIKHNKEGKYIVFSGFDQTFSHIEDLFKTNGITYALIKGTRHMRQKRLKMFRSGEIQVILLNSRMNGAGIDLPETTDIIMYHRMNPALETQSIGRGQRMGRTTSLRVHYLESDHEVQGEYQEQQEYED